MMISDAAPGPAAGPDPGPAARPRANVPVFRRRGGGGPVAAARPGGRLGAQLSARVLSRRVRVTVTVVGSDSLSLRVTTPFVVAGWVHSWAWTSASEFGATLARRHSLSPARPVTAAH